MPPNHGSVGCYHDGQTTGANVVAGASGVIAWRHIEAGCISLNLGDGYYLATCHFDFARSFSDGEWINQGQVLGTVAKAGDKENNGIPHIHLALYQAACGSNTCARTAVPFANAYGTKLDGYDFPRLDDSKTNQYQNTTGLRSTNGGAGAFELVAQHSGRCLEVGGGPGVTGNGANINQWDFVGVPNQRWWLRPAGDAFEVVATHSGKCLDVSEVSQQNGANVHQWDCVGGSNQRWRFNPVGAAFELVAVHSGKCLDVAGISQQNGANVHQWDCWGGSNQRWWLRSR